MTGEKSGSTTDKQISACCPSQRGLIFLADAFCASVPLRQALDVTQRNYGNAIWATEEMQRALVGATLEYGDDLASKIRGFSFGSARCTRFLRLLLDEIDQCGAPVDETLIMRAASLCASASARRPDEADIDSNGREKFRWVALRTPPRKDECRVVLRVADSFSELAMCVWDGGICMYAHIMNPRSPVHANVANARVLELGAGTGLCASAFKKVGTCQVLMTDLPQALDNIKVNIVANDAGDAVSVRPLDFTQTDDVVRVVREGKFNVVVAADVTYDEILVRAIVNALVAVLEDGIAKTAYLFATKRNPESFKLLLSLLQNSPLVVTSLDVDNVDDGVFEYLVRWDASFVYVFSLSSKN